MTSNHPISQRGLFEQKSDPPSSNHRDKGDNIEGESNEEHYNDETALDNGIHNIYIYIPLC